MGRLQMAVVGKARRDQSRARGLALRPRSQVPKTPSQRGSGAAVRGTGSAWEGETQQLCFGLAITL